MKRLAAVALATLAFIVGGTCSVSVALAAEVPVPALTGRVVDQAGILSPEQLQSISRKLAAFEQVKGSQVAVLVVPTTGGEGIEDFATRVTDQWKLGRAGVDDGVLLVVAMQERRMRIQTGRGVQGALTDALSKRIIAERMTPLFRAGDFAGGISTGVEAIIAAVSGESLPPPARPDRGTAGTRDDAVGNALFLALMLVPVGALFLRAILGRFVGGAVTGLITGTVVALALGSLLLGLLAGALAFFFTFLVEANKVMSARGHSGWGSSSSGSGGASSWGGSGGGFGGGGGGFDGGGASGSW